MGGAFALLIVRLGMRKGEGLRFPIMDIISLALMVFSYYFFVFPAVSLQTVITTNVPVCTATQCQLTTQVANYTTSQPAIIPYTYPFIMLGVFTALWVILCVALMMRDFIASRNS